MSISGYRLDHLLQFKYLPGAECPLKLAHKFLKVVLNHAVQANKITVDVVEDFKWRWLRAEEKQCSGSGEDFDVALEGREQGDQAVGQAAFAAHPRDDGTGHDKPPL